jgi:hypothetical protein
MDLKHLTMHIFYDTLSQETSSANYSVILNSVRPCIHVNYNIIYPSMTISINLAEYLHYSLVFID